MNKSIQGDFQIYTSVPLRASTSYANEMKKLERNGSKKTLYITLQYTTVQL